MKGIRTASRSDNRRVYSVHQGKCEATSRHFRQFLTTFRAETDQPVLFSLLLTLSRGTSTRFGSDNLETPQQTELSETALDTQHHRTTCRTRKVVLQDNQRVVMTAFLG